MLPVEALESVLAISGREWHSYRHRFVLRELAFMSVCHIASERGAHTSNTMVVERIIYTDVSHA